MKKSKDDEQATDVIDKPLSNIAQNLRVLMTTANISEHELSRRTNIKQPIIHRLLSGENTNPKLQTIKPIADYFLVSVSELIGEKPVTSTWSGFTSSKHYAWVELPLINYSHAMRYSNVKPSRFIRTECEASEDAFAIFVSDKSMEPVIPEKSIAIIEPDLKPRDGDYVVIQTSKNELILRNIHLTSDEAFISALNSQYDSIRKLINDDKVLGVAIRIIYDHILIQRQEN